MFSSFGRHLVLYRSVEVYIVLKLPVVHVDVVISLVHSHAVYHDMRQHSSVISFPSFHFNITS